MKKEELVVFDDRIEEEPLHSSWKREAGGLSPLALQDFGKYLSDRPERRAGNMTCLQVGLQVPLEVRFFGSTPEEDDVFEVTQDNSKKTFEVITVHGDPLKIKELLKEFGFVAA